MYVFQIVHYGAKLDSFLRELKDLNIRVAMLESSPDNYIKLDFELLRIELREFEALVSQLQESLNSSSPVLDSLYTEVKSLRLTFTMSLFQWLCGDYFGAYLYQIHNMTLIVNQLETFDKSNLEVIRIEFAKLQRKLEECQKEQDFIKPDIGKSNKTISLQ